MVGNWIIRAVTVIGLYGVVACTPRVETTTTIAPTVSVAVQSSTETVTATTLLSVTQSITQAADTAPGQSAAEAASDEAATDTQNSTGELQPGTMTLYTDNEYHFTVNYPANFVINRVATDKLAQLIPQPVAAITWMRPDLAASAHADLEPADLEIRFYPAEPSTSLEAWLSANGLWTADSGVPLQEFQTATATGVHVCLSTMIMPNCFDFVQGADWIYQLVVMTSEGEEIGKTFAMLH